ncbi:PASTA domain-containing protein [Ruminococcus sp. AF17-6LB]|uniref:PASTA domain-containing protein n=1 Tax=unclassified Ruminococcus TaxID=2608920 RepID=UPI000E4719DA|nr:MULTISPECIES: PASTA domain-containing protein [unclassified Ruminococcus]RGG66921.1 PASTA domain-containing protein [Ruminococcus sp. AF17-6LB]RGG68996.1 PASTA domain-containing protein [Ruminococcus sp. AF17-6]RGG69340.1 PASTA domain-containing protein [Ruminococcus sp. AF17-24]RGG76659.1 PASTA domain-containing protein [Ruminococcus sp. AF17-1AC]
MKMTDIMKKSHSESKSENLDAILQKIDNKAFITNSADSAHTETNPQPIKLRRKSIGIAAAAACAAIAVGAFAFSGLLKPDIDTTTPAPSTASTDTTTQPPQTPQHITVPKVINKTYAEAEKLIAQAGGTPVRRDRYSDTVAAETVMNTEPAAGEEIQAGQEVNLFVSKGPVPEQRTYIHNDSSQTDSDEQTDKQLTEDELGTYEAADIEIPTFTERLTDLENTDDLDIILSALNSRTSDFGIISAENHETYLDVTVNTENDVTCTKAYLQAYGINIDLVDVHTAYPEPTGDLPISDTPITNPYKVSNLLCELSNMGYQPEFTYWSEAEEGISEIGVIYEHNIEELKDLLEKCNVDVSLVRFKLMGKAETLLGYKRPNEYLEEVKDVFHINDVRIAITGKTSYVDAYAIDISDTEKLADIAGYITSYFSDDILYSIPISLNGSDYFFVHK